MGQEEYNQLINALSDGATLVSHADVLADVVRDKGHDPKAPNFKDSK
ncbi:hypothetical protein [Enterococcus termitis]|nr:hypothetical protein [Enterococcus termitis]OJG98647.1 hypothetical protein RV18_GL003070 [Enterococcus termitis]